jgi:hypothetical protein
MPRGMTKGAYVTNGGTSYLYRVDADEFLSADRGWASGTTLRAHIPKGFRPRHVTGLSPTSGRRGTAVLATKTCNLYTGAATTFTVEANDNTLDTMNVVNVIDEFPSLP